VKSVASMARGCSPSSCFVLAWRAPPVHSGPRRKKQKAVRARQRFQEGKSTKPYRARNALQIDQEYGAGVSIPLRGAPIAAKALVRRPHPGA